MSVKKSEQFVYPEIRMINGRAALFIDDQLLSPMAFCIRGDQHALAEFKPEYANDLGESGFDLFMIFMDSGWQQEDIPAYMPWEDVEQQADLILDANPNAVFLLRLACHPSKVWFDANPDELVQFEDGSDDSFRPHTYGSFEDTRQVCYASEKYAGEAARHIRNAIDFVESRPFGKRVIGYHVAGGCCGEWNYLRGTKDDICADFSPAFRKFYGKWLLGKYGTEEALRKAWADENATFENPGIPTTAEQVFTEGEVTHNGKEDPVGDFGNFLDPKISQFLIDFYEARTAGTAKTIEEMAKVVKERTNGRVLTGAFWGTMMALSAQTYSVSGPQFLIDSPYIDYLTTPSQYYDRQAGGGSTFRMPVDSLHYRGKLYINESDSRTHFVDENNKKQFCRANDLNDTKNILNRDFAQVICDDIYSWWFEMGTGDTSYYNHPEVFDIFRQQQRVAKENDQLGRGKVSEIAVVYDQDSMFNHPFESMRDILAWNRSQTIPRIGAPCDHIFHDDLDLENLPDYKMYIFLNCHTLTNKERAVIDAKVKRNGNTVVWAYSNGLINPDRDNAIDLANMKALTGFEFGCELAARPVTFKVTDTDNALVKNVSHLPLYGRMPRPLVAGFSFMVGESMIMDETLANPLFYVNDSDATILGRFVANDKAAYAVKDLGDWRSIYIGSKILPANILRSIAREAGVHIYLEDGDYIWPFRKNDIIYANKNYLAIVAEVEDNKRILLPKVYKTVMDAFSGEVLANNSDVVELIMTAGETRIFKLCK